MGKHDVDKPFDATAVLTFPGDGTATRVLDDTQTFTIDLMTGGVTCTPWPGVPGRIARRRAHEWPGFCSTRTAHGDGRTGE